MRDRIIVGSKYLWPGRFHQQAHISTRQCALVERNRVTFLGLEATAYGTHYGKKTGNLAAVHLRPGHTRVDGTGCLLGLEPEDALAFAQAIEIWCGRTSPLTFQFISTAHGIVIRPIYSNSVKVPEDVSARPDPQNDFVPANAPPKTACGPY